MKKKLFPILLSLALGACSTESDSDLNLNKKKETDVVDSGHSVELSEVATLLANIQIDNRVLDEVASAVNRSVELGLDENYKFSEIMHAENRKISTRSAEESSPLKERIMEYVSTQRTQNTKSTNSSNILEILSDPTIQIYWPYADDWDGVTTPVITFNPKNDKDWNYAFKRSILEDGTLRIDTIIINEEYAQQHPVWVINNSNTPYNELPDFNRNEFTANNTFYSSELASQYTNKKQLQSPTTKAVGDPVYTITLGTFKATQQYDNWLSGGSEFMIQFAAVNYNQVENEAPWRGLSPNIMASRITRTRKEIRKGKEIRENIMLISDWGPSSMDGAFMIHEEDAGGRKKFWETKTGVMIKDLPYEVNVKLPFYSNDDLVYRTVYDRDFIFSTGNYENGKFVKHHAGGCYWTIEIKKATVTW
jgi:hypothetical protein